MTTLVSDAATVEFSGREPWPDDVKLYQPYENEQVLMSDYASCLSVKTFLKMLGLPFTTKHRINAEYMSPNGCVPFIRIGSNSGSMIVAGLEPIIAFVGAKSYSLSGHLSDTERADMRAYMALVENTFVNAELYLSWNEADVWNQVTLPRCQSGHTWPLSVILPRQKRRQHQNLLAANGWKQKTLHQVWEEVETCCHALSEKLGDQKYFLGDRMTDLDALVYAHLFTIITTQLPIPTFAQIIRSFSNLAEFVRRIDVQFFDEAGVES